MTTMFLKAKSVYGQTKLYPACEVAHAFADAIGVKTLNDYQIKCAERMGFDVVVDAMVTTGAMVGNRVMYA